MLQIAENILLAITLGLAVPVAVLGIECLAAFFPGKPQLQPNNASLQRAVLIPAHNEASCIGLTLDTILPQLTDRDLCLVIADNCTDATAEIAHSKGATVIERHNKTQLGKGYALDYGLQFLASNPPQVVALIDADSNISPGTLDMITQEAIASNRPVQATYLMQKPPNPSPKDLVSALAFTVKNLVRPTGLHRLNLPCLLTGTGIAIPWTILNKVSLASDNIVEDMQLGLDLAIAGHPPLFCPNTKITSILPAQATAAKTQRTRWEHGHLQTLTTQVPRLLKAAWEQKRIDLLALALEMCVPPLSLLVMLWATVMAAALSLSVMSGFWSISILAGVEGLVILISIFAAWARFARADLPLKTLLAVPFYLLWKIPLYLAFLLQPQKAWVRTERDK